MCVCVFTSRTLKNLNQDEQQKVKSKTKNITKEYITKLKGIQSIIVA